MSSCLSFLAVSSSKLTSLLRPTGGFTFSGEGESMIHHAAGVFANTHIHPPSPPTTSTTDKDDEWEDTPMKGA